MPVMHPHRRRGRVPVGRPIPPWVMHVPAMPAHRPASQPRIDHALHGIVPLQPPRWPCLAQRPIPASAAASSAPAPAARGPVEELAALDDVVHLREDGVRELEAGEELGDVLGEGRERVLGADARVGLDRLQALRGRRDQLAGLPRRRVRRDLAKEVVVDKLAARALQPARRLQQELAPEVRDDP
eukprot:748159-Rhodomonas_salina.1